MQAIIRAAAAAASPSGSCLPSGHPPLTRRPTRKQEEKEQRMDGSREQSKSNDEHLAMIIPDAIQLLGAPSPSGRFGTACRVSDPIPPPLPGKVRHPARWSPEMPQLIPIWERGGGCSCLLILVLRAAVAMKSSRTVTDVWARPAGFPNEHACQ